VHQDIIPPFLRSCFWQQQNYEMVYLGWHRRQRYILYHHILQSTVSLQSYSSLFQPGGSWTLRREEDVTVRYGDLGLSQRLLYILFAIADDLGIEHEDRA
jgi:hypothetical protein